MMKIHSIIQRGLDYLNLEPELENQELVYEEIKKGIIFKGTNLWILIFAIIVASVGLNMNSTAVIIGAMLISPLMGPINAMGYSIATYDLDLFRKALKNYAFAILASLVASTAYFALSPVSTAHSELLARTSPTIYDVLIALFGGLAGIIAISSKNKGNVIPGVAIATALMPPLCTAGYGIATGQFEFFFGAFYLFTINTIFIALASVWVSQILKFPIRTIVDNDKKKKIDRAITLVIIIVLLPSIFFGYKLVKKEEFILNANQYVSNVSLYEGNYLLKSDIDAKLSTITLVYGGSTLSENQKNEIAEKSKNFHIKNATIQIEQGLTFSSLDDKNIELFKLREQIVGLNTSLTQRNLELDSILIQQEFGETLLSEIKTIFPQVQGSLYAESLYFHDSLSSPQRMPIVILSVDSKLVESDKKKLNNWVKQRLKNQNAMIYYE